jgi:tripartite-type tricarboxylate transporter receptor subunit TctC
MDDTDKIDVDQACQGGNMRLANKGTRKLVRGFATAVASLVIMAAMPIGASAQSGTIKVIFPFAAGGSGDVMARIVADRISFALGTPAIVENRTGAAGRIGAKSVAAAAPDGLTLLFASSPMMVIYPHSYAALDYDPVKDFEPVTAIAAFDIALVVGPQATSKTAAELVTWVKSNPTQASYGSPGAGGLGHFVAVMFATTAKLDLRHVTYRGSGPVVNDLLGGQLPMAVLPLGDVTALHQAGKVRAMATAGPKRSSFLPEVPTLKEAGFDMIGQGWYGLYAPARTPSAVIDRINKAVVDALQTKDIKSRVAALSLEPIPTSPSGLAALGKADRERWGPVVKASGFKPAN